MIDQPPQARHFPATARNREAIRDVLNTYLPKTGTVLEIGSGSGEHALYFSEVFPDLTWQPTDPDPLNLASIQAWQDALPEARENLLTPLSLNASDVIMPVERADAVLCINVIHISPWDATVGLLRNAASLLPRGGIVYLYGPYRVKGAHTATSNEAFDRQLRSENETWGVRDLEDVTAEAERNGLSMVTTREMPANNLSVVFRRGLAY